MVGRARRRPPQLRPQPSISRASAKSASVSPPCECVESVRRTLFQPCTRMSGWWLAASASLGHAVDERDRGGEVGELHSRTIASAASRAASPRPRPAGARSPRRSAVPLREITRSPRPHHGRRRRTAQRVRIVSLVPHATELLFALGLGPEVVAVTHECDYPPAARALPRGHARRAAGGPGRGRDRRGRARAHAGGRGDLRARPRGAGGARARPDRHAGAVPGVRGLLRRGRGARRASCRPARA